MLQREREREGGEEEVDGGMLLPQPRVKVFSLSLSFFPILIHHTWISWKRKREGVGGKKKQLGEVSIAVYMLA